MSHDFTPTQIQERFQSLPQDIQDVISGADTAQQIEEIGRRRGLRIDGIGILIEYSGLIMLGFLKSNEFVDELTRQLSISREKAETIAVDIDTQVFSRIRESLRKVQYQPTVEKRFEETADFPSSDNAPSSKEPSEPETEEEVVLNFSAQDYESQDFSSPASISPEQTTKSPSPATAETSDVPQESPQEEAAPAEHNTETDVHTPITPSVDDVLGSAPEDPYLKEEVAAPASEVDEEALKDFKTRLEEKLAQSDTATLNKDPYRESI